MYLLPGTFQPLVSVVQIFRKWNMEGFELWLLLFAHIAFISMNIWTTLTCMHEQKQTSYW